MQRRAFTPREIERWIPANLNQVVGCDKLKRLFFDQLRQGGCGVNTFVTGESGSGKTSTVKAFVRSLRCPNLDMDKLLPCEQCEVCITFDVRFSEYGLFPLLNIWTQEREPINYFPVNCGEVTESMLRDIVNAATQCNGRIVIYLDEVHRLVRRRMDHALLIPLEEADAVWIASTAYPRELDEMFHRRFAAKVNTTLPDSPELVAFLQERCREWGIDVDAQSTLESLARRSRRVPSAAISVIAVAAGKPSRRLCLDDIERCLPR